MSWDKDVPAAGIQARYLDDAVRTNNAAIDVVIGDLLDAATAITATAAELNIMDGVTASTAELNILDGVTATAAELNILDGVTASAAELNQCDDKTLLNTTDTQNFAAKTSTDGFRVTGGDLTVRPASGTVARVLAGTAAETALTLTAGGYTSQNDSAMVVVYSSDDATYPGIVALIGSNGTTGATGLTVSATGVVNIPVSLQIGGVAVSAVTSANAVSSGAKSLSSDTAIVSLASQTLVSGDYFDIVVEVTGQKQTSAGDVVLYLVTNNTIVSTVAGKALTATLSNALRVMSQYIGTFGGGTYQSCYVTVPCVATGSGNATISLRGYVNTGGDWDIADGAARIGIVWRKNQ